jgi:NDP-sugar pyrophosphorylase family protein
MRPLTEQVPKSLLPALERPFVDYQLKWLAENGVTDVVFSIGYKGEMLREFVGDGKKWGLNVSYADEGKDLRGTAGAIRLALDRGLLPARFLVLYGDSFLPVNFGEVWKAFLASGKPALMTVFENGGRWDTSNVIFEDGNLSLYQKNAPTELRSRMRHIDYGLSALDASVVSATVPSGTRADLADLFHQLSRGQKLAGYPVTERFYEIGSPQGLADFERWLGEGTWQHGQA